MITKLGTNFSVDSTLTRQPAKSAKQSTDIEKASFKGLLQTPDSAVLKAYFTQASNVSFKAKTSIPESAQIKPIPLQSVVDGFQQVFNRKPEKITHGPGRVSINGDHTDNYRGHVFPAAINCGTYAAAALREDDKRIIRVFSENLNKAAGLGIYEFDLDAAPIKQTKEWHNYVEGTIRLVEEKLQEKDSNFKMPGFDLYLNGNIPGSGLSSSASLETATGLAALKMAGKDLGKDLSPLELAKVGQKAEHTYVGTMCGLMDQFATTFGEDGFAIMMDTRDSSYKHVPFDFPNHSLVICNSGYDHKLAGDLNVASEYNARGIVCAEGFKVLKENLFPEAEGLCEITPEQFNKHEKEIKRLLTDPEVVERASQKVGKQLEPDTIFKRCKHPIFENDRILKGAKALEAGDIKEFGRIMYESHNSLKNNFEVTIPQLDTLVKLGKKSGAIGARMCGGGFGGNVVVLIENNKIAEFINKIEQQYKRPDGKPNEIYVVKPSQGVKEVPLPA